MNASIYRISLELQEPCSNVLLNVKRGDTNRRLHISLTDGGHPYRISEECTAVFTAVKPDGHKVFNHCQIRDNEIIYAATAQTVAAEGTCECEIKLYGADDHLLTSARFDLVVNATVYNEGDEIESSDEFDELARLIGEASAVPSSLLLREGDRLDELVRNGRYYCTGAVNNGLIRTLLEGAGISIPEKMTQESAFACALFVDVTRQERNSGSPEDVVGRPCQHLTVYFLEDKTTNYWKYEYHRAREQSGSDADGTSWGKWYSPTHSDLEVEKEIFVAEYGVTTYAEIKAAYDAEKVCKCRNGLMELVLVNCGGPAGAMFSGIQTTDTSATKGNRKLLHTYICSPGNLWGSATHRLADEDDIPETTSAITEAGTDDQIPTAKAVWDFGLKKLDAEKLPEAVEDALAQAKASGEFDGPQGPQGERGEQGIQGLRGPQGEPGPENLFTAIYGVTTNRLILEAKEAGKVCVAVKNDVALPLTWCDGTRYAMFSGFAGGSNLRFIVTSTDGWSEANTQYLAKDDLDTFVAKYGETTYDEVMAANSAGKLILAGYSQTAAMLDSIRPNAVTFRTMPTFESTGPVATAPYYDVWTLTPYGWAGAGGGPGTSVDRRYIGATVIDESSDDKQLATAKAVWDLFQSLDEAAALEDLAEAGIVNPVADENNAVFVDENNHIFTL